MAQVLFESGEVMFVPEWRFVGTANNRERNIWCYLDENGKTVYRASKKKPGVCQTSGYYSLEAMCRLIGLSLDTKIIGGEHERHCQKIH